jgi:hypothetical protein
LLTVLYLPRRPSGAYMRARHFVMSVNAINIGDNHFTILFFLFSPAHLLPPMNRRI